jgi:hypothetical protein
MIYVFYHIFCNKYTESIVRDQMMKFMFSGIYNKVDTIFYFLIGEDKYMDSIIEFFKSLGSKFELSKRDCLENSYERFTLHSIFQIVKPEDKILYIHSKGVTKIGTCIENNVYDWRTYMEYFLFVKHETCINLLDSYDTVGVNLQDSPLLHYSGNFWWCRGDYYLKLDSNHLTPDYHSPEMFICRNSPRAYSFFSSNCNHYHAIYSMNNYVK